MVSISIFRYFYHSKLQSEFRGVPLVTRYFADFVLVIQNIIMQYIMIKYFTLK